MANSNLTMPVQMAVSQAMASFSPVGWLKLFFKNDEDLNLYRYVALVASLILFHYSITGFIGPGSLRGKISRHYSWRKTSKLNMRGISGRPLPRNYPKAGTLTWEVADILRNLATRTGTTSTRVNVFTTTSLRV